MADVRESMAMRKIFIGGLNKSTTDEEMNDHFVQYGTIKDLIVMKGDGGVSRGFGFITYQEADSVEKVFQARPINLGGKVLDCKRAMPKELNTAGAHTKTNKMFLGGIPKSCTEDDFRKYIEGRHKIEYGTLTDINIIKDKVTQESKGYAFLECSSTDFADRLAICEADFYISDRKCQMKKAEDKEGFGDGAGGGRGRGRGGAPSGGRGGERGGFSRGGPRGGRGGERGVRGGGRGARGGERGGARGGGYGQGAYGSPYGQGAYGAPVDPYNVQAQDPYRAPPQQYQGYY